MEKNSNTRLVALLEDNQSLGDTLKTAFEGRGFETLLAESQEQLFALLDKVKRIPSVVVLDMNLNADKTGAEVGQMLRLRYHENAPEFIIYSAYNDPDYYKAAFRLGAATYLNKTDVDHRMIITTARVLSILREIRNCSLAIHDLVTACLDLGDAIVRVTKGLLVPALEQFLGAKFTMLMAANGNASCFGGDMDVPAEHPMWTRLNRELTSIRPPAYLDMKTWLDDQEETMDLPSNRLSTATVVPLYQKDEVQLSMIIADGSDRFGSMDERARTLAETIGTHFRAPLVDNFFSTTHVMAESAIRRREQLDATARFCFYVGTAQQNIYEMAERENEIPQNALVLPRLNDLSRGLRDIGTHWDAIKNESHTLRRLDAFQLVDQAWKKLGENEDLPENMLNLSGSCYVLAHDVSLERAINRILVWMIGRLDKYGDGIAPQITISAYEINRQMNRISFQDQSKPLPEPMIEQLLLPFNDTQYTETYIRDQVGLFEAKLLVEWQNAGKLSARRPEPPLGNRLDMLLRAA
ncbi:MAG: response regulator [Acidobacteriota bacterium]|nr:response regulator [Acidobacteriota bacterium]